MSELNKLIGIGKKVKLGEIEVEIKPLTVTALPLLLQLSEGDQQASAMKELITLTLKGAVPDATEEEIANIPLEHMKTLMEAIMDINKLDEVSIDEKELIKKIKQ